MFIIITPIIKSLSTAKTKIGGNNGILLLLNWISLVGVKYTFLRGLKRLLNWFSLVGVKYTFLRGLKRLLNWFSLVGVKYTFLRGLKRLLLRWIIFVYTIMLGELGELVPRDSLCTRYDRDWVTTLNILFEAISDFKLKQTRTFIFWGFIVRYLVF